MSIISGFVAAAVTYGVMKLLQKFHVEPTYAEFGRMSKLVWKYDWNFGKTPHGSTSVWKEGEITVYTFSGLWMYKLLMKDRPSQERIIEGVKVMLTEEQYAELETLKKDLKW